MNALDAITHNIKIKYPHLLEDGVSIVTFEFWDCDKNKAIPSATLDMVKDHITINNIKDYALVIYFSNNIIGYRLDI